MKEVFNYFNKRHLRLMLNIGHFHPVAVGLGNLTESINLKFRFVQCLRSKTTGTNINLW
jgi:hypothetical protein